MCDFLILNNLFFLSGIACFENIKNSNDFRRAMQGNIYTHEDLPQCYSLKSKADDGKMSYKVVNIVAVCLIIFYSNKKRFIL